MWSPWKQKTAEQLQQKSHPSIELEMDKTGKYVGELREIRVNHADLQNIESGYLASIFL